MLTRKFKIRSDNANLIKEHQKRYSYAFRVVYNNLDLQVDPGFISDTREKYGLSAKMYEYLVKEAIVWWDKLETRKKKLTKTIVSLKKGICVVDKKKRDKINKRIQRLENSVKREYVFGSRELARKMTKEPENIELKKEWKERRNYFMIFPGETSKKGSRFFDFKYLNKGIVTFKPDKNTKIEMEFGVRDKKTQQLLDQLQYMAENKKISISVKLSSKELHISYDEQILNGTKFDAKKIYKDIAHIKDKGERRAILARKHREHEKYLFADKIDTRYCALDLNPDGIGLVIGDRLSPCPKGDFKIIHKEYIDFSKLNKNLKLTSDHKRQKKQIYKRKYELTIGVKHIFSLMKHHKVAHLVTEELCINPGDVGNKYANRRINNLWNRTLLSNLFDKYCGLRGLKHTEINPAYSSFVGNVLHEDYDPISAAIEILRRGIIKYIKNSSIFPEFCTPWTSSSFDNLSKKMYEKLKDCETWKELYDLISTAKKSVRRKMDTSIFSANCLESHKSLVTVWKCLG